MKTATEKKVEGSVSPRARIKRTENAVRYKMKLSDAVNVDEYLDKVKNIDARRTRRHGRRGHDGGKTSRRQKLPVVAPGRTPDFSA